MARRDRARAPEVHAFRLGDILGVSNGPVRTHALRSTQKKLQDGHAHQAQGTLRDSPGESASNIVLKSPVSCNFISSAAAVYDKNTNVA